MKSSVLGLACAAGLAASGCQSPGQQALARWKESNPSPESGVVQTSHEVPAGLQKSPAGTSRPSASQAIATGEKALQQFYHEDDNKANNLQRARIQFEAAAKADPTNAVAQHRLGIVADLQERFHESETFYRTAMSLDPKNGDIAADLGWSFILQERWQDAERILQRAVQLDPQSRVARENLARARDKQSPSNVARQAQPSSDRMELSANQPASVSNYAAQGNTPAVARSQAGTVDPRMSQHSPADDRMAQGGPDENPGETLRNQLSRIDQDGQSPQMASRPDSIMYIQKAGQTPAAQDDMQQSAPGGPSPDSFRHQPSAYGQSAAASQDWPAVQGGDQRLLVNNQQPGGYDMPQARGAVAFPHYEPKSQRTAALREQMNLVRPPAYGFAEPQNAPLRAEQANMQIQDRNGNLIRQAQPGDLRPASYSNAQDQGMSPDRAVQSYAQYGNNPSQSYYQPGQQQQAVAARQQAQGNVAQSAPYQDAPYQQRGEQQPSMDEMRRNAAMLGLGLGPGQMFPSLENQSARMSPGTASSLNGNSYPAPHIHSADLMPIPDLRQQQTFFPEHGITPPPNSMGQHMPGGPANMNIMPVTPPGYGSPYQGQVQPTSAQNQSAQRPTAQWGPEQRQPVSQAQGMQQYDETRRTADLMLHQSLSNAWANSPTQAIPTPSAGLERQRVVQAADIMAEGWNQPQAPYSQAPEIREYRRPIDTQALPTVTPSSQRSDSPAQPTAYPAAERQYTEAPRQTVTPAPYSRPAQYPGQ